MTLRTSSATPAVVALALLLATGGCSEEGFHQTESGDVQLEPPPESTLPFPLLQMGRTDVKKVTIRQSGPVAIQIERIYIEGYEHCDRMALQAEGKSPDDDSTCQFSLDDNPLYDGVSSQPAPLELDGGGFREIGVRYRATMDDAPPDTRLVVETNVRGKEKLWIGLSVQGATPTIGAYPELVSFQGGDGGEQRKIITVRNIGTGTLHVSDVQFRLLTPAPTDPRTGEPVPEFQADPRTDLPWRLTERDQQEIWVTYTPVDGDHDEAELVIVSNDEASPRRVIRLTSTPVVSHLTVRPNPVVFEAVGPGRSTSETVELVSDGQVGLNVLEIRIEPPDGDYRLEVNQQRSFPLPAGRVREIPITYAPRSAEGSDALLIIETNADNVRRADGAEAGTLEVPLRRSDSGGLGPIVTVDPPVVDMSDVAPGASREETITLTNSGDAPLEIRAVRFSAEGDAHPPSDPEFEVTAGGEAGDIPPGEERTVTVKFSRPADDRAAHFAVLLIESNAPTSPDAVYFNAGAPRED